MKEITYNNNTLNVKDSWDEITIAEFELIVQILNADVKDNIKFITLISILTSLSEDEVKNLPAPIFNKIVSYINFIKEEPKPVEYKNEYELNGHKYILKADVTTITASQYIDYQNYMKEDPIDSVKLLSLWLIPKGHEYNDGYDLDNAIKDLSSLPVLEAQAIAFFLRKQFQVFMIIIVDSLKKRLKKMKMPEQKTLDLITQLNNMALSLS